MTENERLARVEERVANLDKQLEKHEKSTESRFSTLSSRYWQVGLPVAMLVIKQLFEIMTGAQ